jgi:hypothetical protein
MQRPTEYETLISKGFFENAPATPGAAQALLESAQEHLDAYELLTQAGLTGAAFGAAYDGLSILFQAMFEHYEVRAPDELRTAGTYVMSRTMDLHPAELCLIARMHDRRHQLSTECPFPPATQDEGQALATLIKKYLPVVHATVGLVVQTDVVV